MQSASVCVRTPISRNKVFRFESQRRLSKGIFFRELLVHRVIFEAAQCGRGLFRKTIVRHTRVYV